MRETVGTAPQWLTQCYHSTRLFTCEDQKPHLVSDTHLSILFQPALSRVLSPIPTRPPAQEEEMVWKKEHGEQAWVAEGVWSRMLLRDEVCALQASEARFLQIQLPEDGGNGLSWAGEGIWT